MRPRGTKQVTDIGARQLWVRWLVCKLAGHEYRFATASPTMFCVVCKRQHGA